MDDVKASPDIIDKPPPQYILEVVLGFCQELFRDHVLYPWSEDENTTKIIIRDQSPVDASSLNMRPAVTAVLAGLQTQTLGFEQNKSVTNLRTGQGEYAGVYRSAVTINAISSSSIEAFNLGWFIGLHAWIFHQTLMMSGRLEDIRVSGIGPPTSAEAVVVNDGGKGWYMCPVYCPIQVAFAAQVTPANQKQAQSLETRLNQRFPTARGTPRPLPLTQAPVPPRPHQVPLLPQDAYGGYGVPATGGRENPVDSVKDWLGPAFSPRR